MAHNQQSQSVDIHEIINNAIQSISPLREMQPAMNGRQLQPTIASKVVRLLLKFQQLAPLTNYQDLQRLNNSRQSRGKPTRNNNKNFQKKKVRLAHRDIVFMFNPTVEKVPTHQTRLKLESKGRYFVPR